MTDDPRNQRAEWDDRAEQLLTFAAENVRDVDVIPEVTEALAALYLSMGEAPSVVVIDAAGYRDRRDENVPECLCPPDLIARGGWASRCPVHVREIQ